MAFIGTNVFLGNTLIGQSFLGENVISYSPFDVPTTASISIVTDGLILYFNTTQTACYPGSGTDVFNLVAGQAITGSLVNGVTYKDNYLQFNGTNQYMDVPFTSLDYRLGASTVMGAARYADTSGNGRIISSVNTGFSNWLLGHYADTTLNYYPGGTVQLVNGPNDTNWRIYAGTGDTATDKWSLYVNGAVNTLDSNGGTSGPYGFSIGRNSNSTEWSSGSLAILMVYNRVLTGAEITQNYDALKSTVGLT
jgi:hypothetical protein